jgi:hypothetical protein
MSTTDYRTFSNLTFEEYRNRATDGTLSRFEKIGFPDAYRDGKEEAIFRDIAQKLTNLNRERQVVMDIGPGCSDLPHMLIERCRRQHHSLILVDSQEMLDHLPNETFLTKAPAHFPDGCPWLFDEYAGKVDAILTYSVLQTAFAEGHLFDFLDSALTLLAEGGQMLIGDLPNISKRKRFFSSRAGIKFHQQFTGSDDVPHVAFNTLEVGQIDDSVFVAIILRCRLAGFDAYWLPQADDLPMANRREDILITRP